MAYFHFLPTLSPFLLLLHLPLALLSFMSISSSFPPLMLILYPYICYFWAWFCWFLPFVVHNHYQSSLPATQRKQIKIEMWRSWGLVREALDDEEEKMRRLIWYIFLLTYSLLLLLRHFSWLFTVDLKWELKTALFSTIQQAYFSSFHTSLAKASSS